MIRIKELRTNSGMKQSELAQMLNVRNTTISNWEKGVSQPDNETLLKLSKIFNCSIDYLLGNNSINKKLPPNVEVINPDDYISFPVIGEIRAGYGGIAEERYIDCTMDIPASLLRGKSEEDFFALLVKGNSMYPQLIDGDIVLIERMSSVDSGTIAAVLYNGNEATIKKVNYVYGEDWLELVPINPEYETHRIENADLEECHVLGKVVRLQRDIK